jgi:GDP-4-dehydro-6-deoxy-D-mannose reductase
MRVVLTRTFHHTGPGRGEAFAESSFARQIAEIERGLRPPVLEVGNLDAVRDFTDVRRRARLSPAARQGRGRRGLQRPQRLRAAASARCLDVLLGLGGQGRRAGRSGAAAALRRSGPGGRPSRLRQATGWEPRIPLEQSLADLLEDWRLRVAGAADATP